jgi:DNA-binding MarR family transcriptional regulator
MKKKKKRVSASTDGFANGNSKPSIPPRHLSKSLDESIGFLICDTTRFIKRVLYARISEHGVRGGSWFALRALWLEDGITQRALAQRLGLMEPSVLEMLRSMEQDGLVYRVRDTKDRRKVLVHLTDHAKRLERKLMPIASKVNELMLHQMPLSTEIALKKSLKEIRRVLSDDAYAQAPGASDLIDVAGVSAGGPQARKPRKAVALQRARRKAGSISSRPR